MNLRLDGIDKNFLTIEGIVIWQYIYIYKCLCQICMCNVCRDGFGINEGLKNALGKRLRQEQAGFRQGKSCRPHRYTANHY